MPIVIAIANTMINSSTDERGCDAGSSLSSNQWTLFALDGGGVCDTVVAADRTDSFSSDIIAGSCRPAALWDEGGSSM